MAPLHGIVSAVFEQRHDGVADVFVDDAAMAADDRFHLAEVGVDELEVLARRHGLGQRGEVADVREHDGHLALDLVAELDVDDAFCFEQVEQLVRHQAAVCRLRLLQQGQRLLVGDDDLVQDLLDAVLRRIDGDISPVAAFVHAPPHTVPFTAVIIPPFSPGCNAVTQRGWGLCRLPARCRDRPPDRYSRRMQ